jgi:hypothetical protein
MKSEKAFDCLKMKDDIQASLSKKWAGLTDEQIRERMHQDLTTSDDAVARWWRSVDQAGQATPATVHTK